MHIWVIDGQGGLITNLGWRSFARYLIEQGYNVTYALQPRLPQAIADDITAYWHKGVGNKVVILGYSLGGNSVSWVAEALADVPIDLVVAYDPTLNAPRFPLGKNVKRALSYHNCSRLGTSLLFGGAVLTSTPGGPPIEITNIWNEHLLLQWNSALHRKTLDAINKVWVS